jgi:hypothetical protein
MKDNYCSIYINGHEVKYDDTTSNLNKAFNLNDIEIKDRLKKIINNTKSPSDGAIYALENDPTILLLMALGGLNFQIEILEKEGFLQLIRI